MIKQEILSETLIRTYSDLNLMIRNVDTRELYEEAVDLIKFHKVYEETDIPIDPPESELDSEDASVE